MSQATPDPIAELKRKDIVIAGEDEAEARKYFKEKNSYFRISLYPDLFTYFKSAPITFTHLSHLASLDRHMRNFINRIILDIEHKIKLLIIEDYYLNKNQTTITFDATAISPKKIFLTHPESKDRHFIDVNMHANNVSHHPLEYYLEYATFGEVVWLLFDKTQGKARTPKPSYSWRPYPSTLVAESELEVFLRGIRKMRNMVAHNHPILHLLRVKKNKLAGYNFVNSSIYDLLILSSSNNSASKPVGGLDGALLRYHFAQIIILYKKVQTAGKTHDYLSQERDHLNREIELYRQSLPAVHQSYLQVEFQFILDIFNTL